MPLKKGDLKNVFCFVLSSLALPCLALPCLVLACLALHVQSALMGALEREGDAP